MSLLATTTQVSRQYLRQAATRLRSVVRRLWALLHRTAHRTAATLRRYPNATIVVAGLVLIWLFCLPRPLFQQPFSTVLEDRHGDLLCARISADGQWRFPPADSLPHKYTTAVIAFEDKRFWWHPGVDPLSLSRSLWQNLTQGRVVSGGSTLTMQVIRMARSNPRRTLREKIVEAFMATRLELTHSKQHILHLYADHAPFGGNVVGLEAAAWRYYGKRPDLLSWAEAATLAVLPNSPALIHPGRNRQALLDKRNRLLEKLRDTGNISPLECELGTFEPLPDHPLPLPQFAPHLLDRLTTEQQVRMNWQRPGSLTSTGPDTHRFPSSIDRQLQQRITDILVRRQQVYRGNEIHNLAAIVLDVPTGEVLAYIGNVPGAGQQHQENVDVVAAPRSTGSILKPYLYALALESGDILPNSLLHDVPTQLGDYKPENYYETYDGAVSARRALIRSLNVPFVLLLQQYGLEKCHFNFQRLGLGNLQKPPDHYGLTLILGGAEANLLDITRIYADMGRTLRAVYEAPANAHPPSAAHSAPPGMGQILSPGSIWHTFQAMQEVERPNSLGEWELFRASRRIAWKTGTSFGFRDAWAAGVTPQYAIGVWAGNADGEGRPGLIGVEIAAPVLFEILEQLPGGDAWFYPPYDDMAKIAVCRQSGYRAGEYCEADTTWVPKPGLLAPLCPYHQLLHLDPTGQWQVNSDCASPADMQHRPWFVLPPMEEFYFKNKNPEYRSPPPLRADCMGVEGSQQPMQLIYPKHPTRIYVPIELDGRLGSTVFQVAHRNPATEIHWHLDGNYLGSSTTFHQMALQPAPGQHQLALVDRDGHRLELAFEVIRKE